MPSKFWLCKVCADFLCILVRKKNTLPFAIFNKIFLLLLYFIAIVIPINYPFFTQMENLELTKQLFKF